jgi:hypothetical protein
MSKKKYTAEEIVGMLREAEGQLAKGPNWWTPGVPTSLPWLCAGAVLPSTADRNATTAAVRERINIFFFFVLPLLFLSQVDR